MAFLHTPADLAFLKYGYLRVCKLFHLSYRPFLSGTQFPQHTVGFAQAPATRFLHQLQGARYEKLHVTGITDKEFGLC